MGGGGPPGGKFPVIEPLRIPAEIGGVSSVGLLVCDPTVGLD